MFAQPLTYPLLKKTWNSHILSFDPLGRFFPSMFCIQFHFIVCSSPSCWFGWGIQHVFFSSPPAFFNPAKPTRHRCFQEALLKVLSIEELQDFARAHAACCSLDDGPNSIKHGRHQGFSRFHGVVDRFLFKEKGCTFFLGV